MLSSSRRVAPIHSHVEGAGREGRHFVVSEGLGNGGALIRDTNFGGTYTVDADRVRQYVAGAVCRG